MGIFVKAFQQGVDKAFSGEDSVSQLIDNASDVAVSNQELYRRLAKHCLRFGISPNSRESEALLAKIFTIRPSITK